MRILLTYNPGAGGGGTDVDGLVMAHEQSGHDVKTQSIKDEHWEDRLEEELDLVVIAGGDGTVAEVFKQLAGHGRPAAIVPSGSANNIARSLGYDDDVQGVTIAGGSRQFDICVATWDGAAERFVESAGGGIFAEMVARAEESPGDPPGDDKVELGLRQLADLADAARSSVWRVKADGDDLSGEFIAAEVMNGKSLGPGVPLAPSADTGDGLLDLVLLRGGDQAILSAYARARLEGRYPPKLRFETRRARELVLEPPAGSPFRYDDELAREPVGAVTATVEASLEIVVPWSEESGATSPPFYRAASDP